MKENISKKWKSSILFFIILYTLIFCITKIVLNFFNLEFMNWVYYSSIILIAVAFAVVIINYIKKQNLNIQKKRLKIFLYVSVELFCSFILFIIFSFFIGKTEIIEISHEDRYVQIKNELTPLEPFDYYEYVNLMVRKKEKVSSKVKNNIEFIKWQSDNGL